MTIMAVAEEVYGMSGISKLIERVVLVLLAAVIAFIAIPDLTPWSPTQGAGELLIYKRGGMICLNISRITFYSGKWVVYTLEDGTRHNIPGPYEYYPDSSCDDNSMNG